MPNDSLQIGKPARGSRTGRPIMLLLDQLGRRWSLRILWELRDKALNFRQLQQACDGASPSVLNTRLRELRDLSLVQHTSGDGYELSQHGRDLFQYFAPLSAWAEQWARSLPPKE